MNTQKICGFLRSVFFLHKTIITKTPIRHTFLDTHIGNLLTN